MERDALGGGGSVPAQFPSTRGKCEVGKRKYHGTHGAKTRCRPHVQSHRVKEILEAIDKPGSIYLLLLPYTL